MAEPVIRLRNLRREFRSGDNVVPVLNGINLDIHAGEMVAIMGPSGSGKSTLMNIIGCLDRGWSGTYMFKGHDVAGLEADELAALRRNHFGFIFQHYQLLPDLDATENVEVPAVYAGVHPKARRERARALLARLDLGDRAHHRPNALSGGQQQRVSVARALMNGGNVILADEPTGALDSRSGNSLIALLNELHAEGHTIVIITHDPALASHAQRTIELKDGTIVARSGEPSGASTVPLQEIVAPTTGVVRKVWERSLEALRAALRSTRNHPLRTFLTMLGIIIGIMSVVSVVALGRGTQEVVLENIRAIGTNTVNVFPGSGAAERRSVQTLVPADAAVLAQADYADSVTPQVSANAAIRYRNISGNGSITGVGEEYFRVANRSFVDGIGFDADSVRRRSQDAVIDETARNTLFGPNETGLGKVILVGNVPVQVIGVIEDSAVFGRVSNVINVFVPYTTAMTRILGQSHLATITVRVADTADIDAAEAQIRATLLARHGVEDFTTQNTATIRETIESTTGTLTLLVAAIAVISLVVGGIGVMNIMLVSVTERTREIGVRMAVGARRSDILRQFLTESVLVCLIGGVIGVVIALVAGTAIDSMVEAIRLSFSAETVIAAFVSATMIGVVFGLMPARAASRLDPIVALARE